MKRLSLEDEAGNVRVVPLQQGVLTIGRAPDNDLVLGDRNVSRHHARIRCVNGRCVLEDAGSRYGIRGAQGRVAGETEIRPGQVFQIGDFRLKLLPEDDALTEEPAPEEDVTPLATPVVSRETEALEPLREPLKGDSLQSIRQLEEVARQGWTSDFGVDEPAEKRQAGRYLAAVLVLLVVAAGLGFAYYRLTEEEPLVGVAPTTSSPARPEPPLRQEQPAPSRDIEAATQPEAATREEAPLSQTRSGKEEVSATGTRLEAAARGTAGSVPASERPSAAASGPRPARTAPGPDRSTTKAAAPAVAPSPVAASETPPAENDAYTRAKRRGDECKGSGDKACAIDAYREAMRLTSDPYQKEKLRWTILGLGGTAE
ncbi:MAG TPA: FHA domain-containing protein [Myxococcota bacterium]|nr:FHA domain-containing protein [Myxococcota bacterium]HQK49794.1 FHA domain-containing protein [Myxococcota bacterium]